MDDKYSESVRDTEGGSENMYEVEFPSPDISGSNNGLTLVIALHGYADAGHAVNLAASHLRDALEHRPLATFHTDELIDYRSRRPAVTLASDQIAEVEDSELTLEIIRDNSGRPFLLLSGPEPDFRWSSFADAVVDLADQFQVARTVSLYSAPMTVPHTRPLQIMVHGNDAAAHKDLQKWRQTVTVPGAASLRIEFELNRKGKLSSGFTAQVPHYIMHSDYPLAALRLLQAVSKVGELDLPLATLEQDSARVAEILTEQTTESDEIGQVVNMLEQQYDQEQARRKEIESSPLLGPDGSMPSADELGAEFEAFLATQIGGAPRNLQERLATEAPETSSESSHSEPEEKSTCDSGEESGKEQNHEFDVQADLTDIDNSVSTSAASEHKDGDAKDQTDDEKADQQKRRRGWSSWFRF